MKNIFKFSALAVFAFVLIGLSSCQNEGLDTDQYLGYSIASVEPNPVVRGAQLRIIGGNLENTSEVQFAGGVSVTDIEVVTSGTKSEIRVTVPLEGPEVGPVTLVSKDGVSVSTMADLEFSEAIEIASFSPAEALSGDIVTIKGEYLNNVLCVIFGGEVMVNEFVSQSRSELQVAVPANALTGPVIVSNVDEISDQTTIPSRIYTASDLTIGKPTVNTAAKTTYKSGDVITVSGAHLDMISSVDLTGASGVEFSVAQDGSSLSFNLPASASDGNIVLTSFAGDTFDGGEIETVNVSGLAIKSLADDGRYKAGSSVEITGADLDLVTKVDFTNAEASWYLDGSKIVTTVPETAQDGGVGVTLGSGKQVWTDAIEVVKPVVSGIDKTEAVAGQDVVVVSGEDLDLVTSVTIGDKEHSFIDCSFAYADNTVSVNIPEGAYDGVLTLTSASGYSSTTDPIVISYDMAVSVSFDKESYSLGNPISIVGSNLLEVESIYIKGGKVTSYSVRNDDAMVFALPESITSPGIYRLQLVLLDGSELTWPVPFEVTASFTETFIWEGYEDLAGWSNQKYYGAEDAFSAAEIAVGDIVHVYYTPLADWWQFQVLGGHWEEMGLPELPDGKTVAANNQQAGATYFAFEVTENVISHLVNPQGWGGAMLIQGENAAITGISLIKFGAAETVVWEGDVEIEGWTNITDLGPETLFADAGLSEGMEVRFYISGGSDSWKIQLFDGHWGGMTFEEVGGNQFNNENSDISKGYFSFTATADHVAQLTAVQYWGSFIIIQGEGGKHLTKIAIL